MLRYALPKIAVIILVILFDIHIITRTDELSWGVIIFVVGTLLVATVGPLLDVSRRVMPLNVGKLSAARVLHVHRYQDRVEVQSNNVDFCCHIPNGMFMSRFAPGDCVAIARHPNDDHVAAIVDVTPGAIFSERRRQECANFILQNTSLPAD